VESNNRPGGPETLAVVFGAVPRGEAQDGARPSKVAVAPPVLRGDEDHLVADTGRGVYSARDALGRVALAADA
jgi:hypothetical protein